MRRFIALKLVVPAILALAACGGSPQETSSPQERVTLNNPNHVTPTAGQSFIDHFDEILVDGEGQIQVSAFLNIMPMADDQRAIVLRNFQTPFEVTCTDDLCRAVATGRPAQAVMDITMNGISRPLLELEREVVTSMTRRANGIEFCNVEGMWAKKFFVRRQVQGILLTMRAQQPELVVNVDYDSENFECD